MSEPALTSFAWPGSKRSGGWPGAYPTTKSLGSSLASVAAFLRLLRDERDTGLGILQPLRTGLANERDHVMDSGPVAGPRFNELDPLVRRESSRNHKVKIFGITQPSIKATGAGMSLGSPFGAPPFTQSTMVSTSFLASVRLLENLP